MKRQGHLRPKLEILGLTCPGRESNASLLSGRRALGKRAIRTAIGTSTFEPATSEWFLLPTIQKNV
jgi:hypothetical protein